jgi:hypothetical protein
MIEWQRTRETFCGYYHWRVARRRAWVRTVYANATDATSRRLADRLAASWGMGEGGKYGVGA